MPLYEALDVWKRISKDRAVRYRCFKETSSGRFSVQSADFYKVPINPEQFASLEKQYVELLAEQDPGERAGSFDSLKAAIEAHSKDFRSEKEDTDQ
jgi:hypothetical protein